MERALYGAIVRKGVFNIDSLAEALLREIERVQEIINAYMTVPNGQFAAALMKQDIKTAHTAMMNGDTIQMIAAYEALKGYEL